MKVADIMQKQVDFVSADAKVQDVCRLIFGRGINGVPVCKGKKLVGFITERDVLAKFYPSMQEYVEDPFRTGDFEEMEEKVTEIFSLNVERIMSKNPTIVAPDAPLLRAQSLMFVHKVGRLPVVDKKGNLIGILSKGDIFRALVGEKIPFEQDEQFHDWLSRHYDLIIDWRKRLSKEIPDLVRLFKKEKVKNVLDAGCGTGAHSIALAREGFRVVGLDRSSRMVYVAKENSKHLPVTVQQHLQFVHHEYKDLGKVCKEKFDAVMFMGSGLAHNTNPWQVLQQVSRVLAEKALFICQITNFDKVINVNKRLFDFHIRKSHLAYEYEHAFLRFYDPLKDGFLTLNVCVFDRGEKRWSFRGMHAASIVPLNKEKLGSFLRRLGFKRISFFGGEGRFYYDYLFRKPFKPLQSDVLIVVAKG